MQVSASDCESLQSEMLRVRFLCENGIAACRHVSHSSALMRVFTGKSVAFELYVELPPRMRGEPLMPTCSHKRVAIDRVLCVTPVR